MKKLSITIREINVEAKFIVIEGLEGAGKSTAVQTISKCLSELGISEIHHTREPGGTPLAEELRGLLKQDHEEHITAEAECLMMYAARAQLIHNVIQPKLEQGIWVIGDRHDLSSRAYQGGGRQLSDLVDKVSEATLRDFKPDLTFYLDIDPNLGLKRAAMRGELDRIEKETLDFFIRTRDKYLEIARTSDDIEIIDASQDLDKVQSDIQERLKQRVSTW